MNDRIIAQVAATVAELRAQGLIIGDPPGPKPLLKPEAMEMLRLYAKGVTGRALADRMELNLAAAQQRLKRIAVIVGVPTVRDLPAWANEHLDLAA